MKAFGVFWESIRHEDQYWRGRVYWIGLFLNGLAGLPAISVPDGPVSGQLAARIRFQWDGE